MKKIRKVITLVLGVLMGVTVYFGNLNQVQAEEISLESPRIENEESMQSGQKVTWDCIWFGRYPQTEIVDKKETCGTTGKSWGKESDYEENKQLYQMLKESSGWDRNGDLTLGGVKYRRIKYSDATSATTSDGAGKYTWGDESSYHYFRYEPIKWRVLNVINGKAFLLADKMLDNQKFHPYASEITWKNSTMRSWLNGYDASQNAETTDYTTDNFLDCAFTKEEQELIRSSNVTNGEERTVDKIYLLSQSGVCNNAYGFAESKDTKDEARLCEGTTYARAMGIFSDFDGEFTGYGSWWLRSKGNDGIRTARAFSNGIVDYYGSFHDHDNNGVRPALSFLLSFSDLYSRAGTVCSDGTVEEEKEDYFVIGRDSNNFTHSSDQFCKPVKGLIGTAYPVSPYYYGKLAKNLTWTKELGLLDVMNQEQWVGSCEGLSISLGLANLKQLDIRKLGMNGNIPSCYNELEPPAENVSLRNLINYYTLLQCADKMPEPEGKILNLGDNVPFLDGKWTMYAGKDKFWDSFAEYVKKQNQYRNPVLFSFEYRDSKGKLEGHTILTCGYQENEQYRIIKLYDCNTGTPAIETVYPGRKADYLYLFLDKQNHNFYFSSTEESITPMNDYAQNENWHAFEYYDVDAWNLFDTEIEEKDTKESKNTGNTVQAGDFEKYAAFSVDAGKDFKLTDSEGKYLRCQNGQLSGNMPVYDFDIINDQSVYRFMIEKKNQYTVNEIKGGTWLAFNFGNHYYSTRAEGVSSLCVNKDRGMEIKGNYIVCTAAISLERNHSLFRISGKAEGSLSIGYEKNDIRIDSQKPGEMSAKIISRDGNKPLGRTNGRTPVTLNETGMKTESVNRKIPVNKIKIKGISGKIAYGKKIRLSAQIFPGNATNKKIMWKSSNSKVATVDQKGNVKIKNRKKIRGKTVTITVRSQDNPNIKATYRIKVMKGVVKKIKLQSRKSIKAGKSFTLKSKVTATKGANKKLLWKSSNTRYATVSSKGRVRTKRSGKGKKVKITAMATDGSNKKKTVTIKIQ